MKTASLCTTQRKSSRMFLNETETHETGSGADVARSLFFSKDTSCNCGRGYFEKIFSILLAEPLSCCCTVGHITACYSGLDSDIHLTHRRLGPESDSEKSVRIIQCTAHIYTFCVVSHSCMVAEPVILEMSYWYVPGIAVLGVLSGDGIYSRS